MTKGIEIIKAKFVGKNANGFTYDFMTDIDVMPGDFVVVHSLYGPAMARVTAVGVSSDYKEDALKWVISRVPYKKIMRAVDKYENGRQEFKNKEQREKQIADLTSEIGSLTRARNDWLHNANTALNTIAELYAKRAELTEER